MDSLIAVGDSSAKAHIAKRIEELDVVNTEIKTRIAELEELTSEQTFDGFEFDLLRQLLAVFKANIDDMTIEQKRAAIRTVVRKVVWDGSNAHIILFGDAEDDIELPDISSRLAEPTDTDEDDTFYPIEDADDEAEDCLGKRMPPTASKSHWGEGSIFRTSCGICSKSRPFTGIKSRNSFDKTNCPDRNKILLVSTLCIILLHDVGNQTKIPLDQDIPCFQISLGCQCQIVRLFLLGQRFRKAAGL